MGWRPKAGIHRQPVPRLLRNGAINAEWSLFSTGNPPRYIRTARYYNFAQTRQYRRGASLQQGVIVVPSKWTVYRWIGRPLPRSEPQLACGWHLCIYQGRNFPRLFRWILDGIHRNAVINYQSFVYCSHEASKPVIIWNIDSFRWW